MTIKQQLISAIESLPENATLEDAMEKIIFMTKINSGLKDFEEGRYFSTAEAKTKLGV